jgi:FkbM family methyltransferase
MSAQLIKIKGFKFRLRGSKGHGQFGYDRAALYSVVFLDEYEPLLGEMGPGDVVVDAGANVGFFTLLASRRVGPSGQIVAVEPEPHNVQALFENIKLNGCNNVIIVSKSLSNQTDTRQFIQGDGVIAHIVEEGGVEVVSTTLPSLFSDLGITRVDFLKMDIEGSEIRVFDVDGIDAVLSGLKKAVIEIHSKAADEKLVSFFERHGFSVGGLRRERDGRARLLTNVFAHPLLTLQLYGLDLIPVGSRIIFSSKARSTPLGAEGQVFDVGTRVIRRIPST